METDTRTTDVNVIITHFSDTCSYKLACQRASALQGAEEVISEELQESPAERHQEGMLGRFSTKDNLCSHKGFQNYK